MDNGKGALLEAQKRWGDNAIARCRKPRFTPSGKAVPTHVVGTETAISLTVKGRGLSWEEAFADADSRDAGNAAISA